MSFTDKASGRVLRCPVEAIEYDDAREELHVLLRGGVIYTYHGVPPDAAAEFKAAPSPGVHYMRHIRDVYRSSGGSHGASGLTGAP